MGIVIGIAALVAVCILVATVVTFFASVVLKLGGDTSLEGKETGHGKSDG